MINVEITLILHVCRIPHVTKICELLMTEVTLVEY